MGRSPADLVIQDGQWVCVQTGEMIPHTDVAIGRAGWHSLALMRAIPSALKPA